MSDELSLFDKYPISWAVHYTDNNENWWIIDADSKPITSNREPEIMEFIVACVNACKGKPELVERFIDLYKQLNLHDHCSCDCCAIFRELEGK